MVSVTSLAAFCTATIEPDSIDSQGQGPCQLLAVVATRPTSGEEEGGSDVHHKFHGEPHPHHRVHHRHSVDPDAVSVTMTNISEDVTRVNKQAYRPVPVVFAQRPVSERVCGDD